MVDTNVDQQNQPGSSSTSQLPTSPPLAPRSEVSLSELEAASVGSASEIQDGISVQSLREAALSIPDVEASHDDPESKFQSQSQNQLSSSNSSNNNPITDQGLFSSDLSSATGSTTPVDLAAILGVSAQTLDAASTATSLGFSAARVATQYGLVFAKRLTQVLVALPAMAVDGALLGVAPGGMGENANDSRQPSAAAIAHATVGGLFDGIAMLALGGIDVGSALTGAGLGAAGAGVEGVRRALGSEVLRSLSAFSKLVKREWSASDLATLPPGGLPAYSALGVTRALTAWVLIQLVTRSEYERRQLKGMEEIDVTSMRTLCRQELLKRKQAQNEEKAKGNHSTSEPSGSGSQPSDVKITSETTLPHEEGELIGATIGSNHSSSPPVVETSSNDSQPPVPLDNQEALLGLRRYSRLVLGVYGGVALAWLGALPTEEIDSNDPLEKADPDKNPIVVDGEAPRVQARPNPTTSTDTAHSDVQVDSVEETPEEIKTSREKDEAEFIRAARDSDSNLGIAAGGSGLFNDSSVMPGAFGSSLTSEPEVEPKVDSAAPGTPSTSNPTSAATSTTAKPEDNGRITPQRNGTAYSYLDLVSGKHDNDLFHRTGGLRKGAAIEGSYDESTPSPSRDPKETARTSKPRYYVVTDHDEEKICLILRGSLTVGDIAADLTCESVRWQHAGEESADRESSKGWENQNVTEHQDLEHVDESNHQDGKEEVDLVHEGMYLTAQEIGLPGRPVHRAVSRALTLNPTYSLDIAGHSLGAGVASLLALMWGSTETAKTHSKSGLPISRKIHAYCFASPCVSNQHLAKRMRSIVTSFVVNYDLVCRLSLGSVLDVRNACAWLCYEDEQSRINASQQASNGNGNHQDENGPTSSMAPPPPFTLNRFTQKAFKHQANQLNQDDKESFALETLVLRKTLEANMNQVHLFPPGTVLVSFQKNSFKTAPVHDFEGSGNEKLRLFRVKEKANLSDVFGQIQFVSGMLSDHMPQMYNNSVNDLSS